MISPKEDFVLILVGFIIDSSLIIEADLDQTRTILK
jgi:hypothetical protein